MVHHPAPVHPHPLRHRMSPLESLRRFQIDCGDLEAPPAPPTNEALIPPLPVEPRLELVTFAEAPPDLPPPGQPTVGVETPTTVPPLLNIPTTPIGNLPAPPGGLGLTPEPDSWVLVLTGVTAMIAGVRRRRQSAR